jgi:23S rRNA G2069 N7-methylase RlmK/C1962 C5-methylase RlmI
MAFNRKKKEPLADQVKDIYNRLWLDCEEITQKDAEVLLEAVSYIRSSSMFDRSLSEAFNSGIGIYQP